MALSVAPMNRAQRTAHYKWSKDDYLGKGAFGKVYKGYHIDSGDVVAVKVYDQESLERCMDYYENVGELCKLQCPYIIKYFAEETLKNSKKKAIVMEYAQCSVKHELKKMENYHGLHKEKFMLLVEHCTEALQYLHTIPMAHRDLKADNILIVKGPGERLVFKIADFGFGKKLNSASAAMSTFVGYPPFMQSTVIDDASNSLNLEYTKECDTWSAGCCFFECATGRHPFVPCQSSRNYFESLHGLQQNRPENFVCTKFDIKTQQVVYSDELPTQDPSYSCSFRRILSQFFQLLFKKDDKRKFENFKALCQALVSLKHWKYYFVNTLTSDEYYDTSTSDYFPRKSFEQTVLETAKQTCSEQLDFEADRLVVSMVVRSGMDLRFECSECSKYYPLELEPAGTIYAILSDESMAYRSMKFHYNADQMFEQRIIGKFAGRERDGGRTGSHCRHANLGKPFHSLCPRLRDEFTLLSYLMREWINRFQYEFSWNDAETSKILENLVDFHSLTPDIGMAILASRKLLTGQLTTNGAQMIIGSKKSLRHFRAHIGLCFQRLRNLCYFHIESVRFLQIFIAHAESYKGDSHCNCGMQKEKLCGENIPLRVFNTAGSSPGSADIHFLSKEEITERFSLFEKMVDAKLSTLSGNIYKGHHSDTLGEKAVGGSGNLKNTNQQSAEKNVHKKEAGKAELSTKSKTHQLRPAEKAEQRKSIVIEKGVRGTVKWYNNIVRRGTITRGPDGEDLGKRSEIPFHRLSIITPHAFKRCTDNECAGEPVLFDILQGRNNQSVAINVINLKEFGYRPNLRSLIVRLTSYIVQEINDSERADNALSWIGRYLDGIVEELHFTSGPDAISWKFALVVHFALSLAEDEARRLTVGAVQDAIMHADDFSSTRSCSNEHELMKKLQIRLLLHPEFRSDDNSKSLDKLSLCK